MSRALQGVLRGVAAILDGSRILPPDVKMYREFRCDLSCPLPVRPFLPLTDAEMKALLSLGWHPLGPQLLIDGVMKSVPRGPGTIGPLVYTQPPEEQTLSNQFVALLLDVFGILPQSGRDGLRCELCAGNAARLEKRLDVRRQAHHLLLDQTATVLRHG